MRLVSLEPAVHGLGRGNALLDVQILMLFIATMAEDKASMVNCCLCFIILSESSHQQRVTLLT